MHLSILSFTTMSYTKYIIVIYSVQVTAVKTYLFLIKIITVLHPIYSRIFYQTPQEISAFYQSAHFHND